MKQLYRFVLTHSHDLSHFKLTAQSQFFIRSPLTPRGGPCRPGRTDPTDNNSNEIHQLPVTRLSLGNLFPL